MFYSKVVTVLLISSSIAFAQKAKAADSTSALNAQTALPIVFTQSISANHARVGDPVLARTTQNVHLINGLEIPSGTKVIGHILSSEPFVYNKTPYARQKQSTLSIRFDSLQIAGADVPMNVTVRAMAAPITSWDAREPKFTDLDPLSTVTQIGGDQLTPSQSEVVSRNGDVVAYNKRGGVYAHLIANGNCDASSIEVSVGIYSPSACGLYGFTGVSAEETGSAATPSTLTLVSTHASPKVWKHSTALLEVLPNQETASR